MQLCCHIIKKHKIQNVAFNHSQGLRCVLMQLITIFFFLIISVSFAISYSYYCYIWIYRIVLFTCFSNTRVSVSGLGVCSSIFHFSFSPCSCVGGPESSPGQSPSPSSTDLKPQWRSRQVLQLSFAVHSSVSREPFEFTCKQTCNRHGFNNLLRFAVVMKVVYPRCR